MKTLTLNISDKLYSALNTAAEMQGMKFRECAKNALEEYAKTFNDVMNSSIGEEYEDIITSYLDIPMQPKTEIKDRSNANKKYKPLSNGLPYIANRGKQSKVILMSDLRAEEEAKEAQKGESRP
jgi:hypothetical protein